MGTDTVAHSTVSTNLVVEEVYGVLVEFEGEGFEEGDVVGEYLLVGEVQLQHYDAVDVVVGQEVVYGGMGVNSRLK